MRIILVADNSRTAQFVRKGPRPEGFAVDQAVDGAEGLFMAQEAPCAVALTLQQKKPSIAGRLFLLFELEAGRN